MRVNCFTFSGVGAAQLNRRDREELEISLSSPRV